ncbi:MAG TPA: aminotransferase class V-fold PLP-dependent enzyme [Pyrinomonadaceae bacterium]|nr:aminotransferase class V-fold PLP-dependent enzyme [Pyrinomonadaceae bacterium]
MTLDRRKFLTGAGLTVAAGALGGAALASRDGEATARDDDATDADVPARQAGAGDWAWVRSQFDLAGDLIHLGLFFLASHPRPVREAIERHRRALDANPLFYVGSNTRKYEEEAQAAAAEYLGGRAEEVALTDSTTMGLALVYQGLPLSAGQEILTTAHDHYSHHESARLAAERAGATVRRVALFDRFDAISEDEIVARIARALTPRTRVVGVTWVHSSSGLKLPLRRIAEELARANRGRDERDRVLLVVDGVHGLGVEDETLAETGCDFFVAGTHKWMFGPRGTGVVWARAETWRSMRPVIPAFADAPVGAWMRGDEGPREETRAAWVSPGGFHSFEHRWALPAAFEFHKRMGRARVASRIHTLNEQCKEGLAAMRHVKLYTPRGSKLSAGLICFDVEGMKPFEVTDRLLKRRILATTTPYATSYARLAPCLLNTPEEIERTLREIRALA